MLFFAYIDHNYSIVASENIFWYNW